MCVKCELMAYGLGIYKAENEDLKAQISQLRETLAFYERLEVHVADLSGVVYKEVCNGNVVQDTPDMSKMSKAA